MKRLVHSPSHHLAFDPLIPFCEFPLDTQRQLAVGHVKASPGGPFFVHVLGESPDKQTDDTGHLEVPRNRPNGRACRVCPVVTADIPHP